MGQLTRSQIHRKNHGNIRGTDLPRSRLLEHRICKNIASFSRHEDLSQSIQVSVTSFGLLTQLCERNVRLARFFQSVMNVFLLKARKLIVLLNLFQIIDPMHWIFWARSHTLSPSMPKLPDLHRLISGAEVIGHISVRQLNGHLNEGIRREPQFLDCGWSIICMGVSIMKVLLDEFIIHALCFWNQFIISWREVEFNSLIKSKVSRFWLHQVRWLNFRQRICENTTDNCGVN